MLERFKFNTRGPLEEISLIKLFTHTGLILVFSVVLIGIQAHVTLYHWDLPQALEDEYGGWVNKKIVRDFTAFANVCFREFGDRVKQWTTINEGNVFAQGGYDIGFLPPQHCSPSSIFNCSKGNSSTEPYLVTHNMLLAHASAATLYRNKYQVTNVYYFIHLGLPSKFGDNG
ncbi:beta-glucosidase 10-like [Arachis ipaensis]|uniref:beta-glucosidase 10-like n=1 Tax=Arachis ipaensis TaxID=130454 RepID=UPI000A2B2030|nr:beta-glucosidase 10-like [Arachis ipaensis]